jgi:hypothetical protein
MLRKYQKVENAEVISPEGHDLIQDELRKTGKTSVQEMTSEEKHDLSEKLDDE